MASITLRSIKGSPLTITEVDNNFSNLNIEVGTKLDTASYTAADVLTKLKTVDVDDSGLNASTLKGLVAASINTVSTLVSRDSSGNFAAGTITATLVGNVTGNVSGNAGTATNGVVTSGAYSDPAWITTLAASKVGLGNVTNESKATMFAGAALTGVPTAPTAANGTNTTQIATTAFVTNVTNSLGTLSTQNANAVAITGGSLTGVTVSGTFTGNVTGNVSGSSGSCTGNSATATSAANAIGVGQSWQNVTGSRSAGTTYTNSSGRPIFISVRMDQDDGTLTLTVDGHLVGRTGYTAGPVYYTLTSIIPAGSTYLVGGTGGSLTWFELR